MVAKFQAHQLMPEDGTTPIGTFTIDPATGAVTFTPLISLIQVK